MDVSTDGPFFIDAWRIEPALNRISREGTVRQLDPRTMQVLLCLAEHAGEVVRRDELMDRVWGEVIVSENTLSSVVARLRKSLDDDWQQPRYIETISKSGYRLIAPVQAVPTEKAFLHGDSIPIMTLGFGVDEAVEQGATRGRKPSFAWGLVGSSVLVGILMIVGILWWVKPDTPAPSTGLDPQPLLTLPGTETAATLSPDGSKVAFMWQGPDQDNWDVYVMLIGESNPVRLTNSSNPEGLPAWSSDGQYLAFVRGDMAAQTCAVYKMPVIGGPETRIGDCGTGITSLAWSSDEAYLAIGTTTTPQEPPHLVLWDIEKQEGYPLTQAEKGSRGDQDPVFSPDHEQIAFRRRRQSGGWDIFVVPTAGGPAVQRSFDQRGTVGGVDWTPDGKHLLFSSSRDGEYRLWQMSSDGGEPIRLPLNDQGLTGLRHASNANRIVYRVMRDETDLWLLRLDENQGVAAPVATTLSSTREELFPQFSPTGDRIAFLSKRTGFYEVWTGNPDGTALIQHTTFEGALIGPPRWSPDGTTLVFDARPEGHADLFLVDAESAFPRRITGDPFDDVHAQFSRDGQWLYFSSNRSGQREIWKMNVERADVMQVTQHNGLYAEESLDGRDLYFTRGDTLGIWKMPLAGGTPSLVVADLSPNAWGNWTLAADGLYFTQQSTKAIAFYDFGTGTSTPLHTPTKTTAFIGPALTVSSDGRSIIYAQIERSEDEILFVDYEH